jgi:hypothetical protein
MPKYRVLEKSFINNTIAEEGEIVEYSGKAGRNLELVEDEPAPKRKAAKTAEEASEDAN